MRAKGFTLVELMIVVAIIGVLAVIAAGSYRKYSAKARSSEVYAMFGEFRAKQEAYRAESSSYCNASADCATVANEDTFYPALLTTAGAEPRAKLVSNTTWPVGWTQLGINPGKSALYCGYVTVAGNAANFGSAGTKGAALWSTAPTGAMLWWYVRATCDNDGKPARNAYYLTGSNTTAVVVEDEGF